jgi:predicted DNA-binding antitoxin AbrB/MazE fold protein
MTISAKYENGVFKPLDVVNLKDGTVIEIYLPSGKYKRSSVKGLPITSMWKNCRDIKDGVSYVDRLREPRR